MAGLPAPRDSDPPYSAFPEAATMGPGVARAPRRVSALVHNMALQDWVLIFFHAFLLARALGAPDSADASMARRTAFTLLTVTMCTVALVRGDILPAGRPRALVYRLGTFVPVLASYFEIRWLLPALQPMLLDAKLLAIDELLFGITPAVWLARFNTLHVTEWFSFFYYSYFTILTLVVLPSLFLDRGRRQIEVLIGAMCVACIGHIGYTLVPGVGPYAAMIFKEPIHGGFWWSQVEYAVFGAGSMMDIFPSLHTAYPTFFALHAFGNRDRAPFKYVWPVLAFFAANIIVATMLLRWHYGIDVVFGLMLAFTARRVSVWVASREQDRDVGGDRQPVWEPLWSRDGQA